MGRQSWSLGPFLTALYLFESIVDEARRDLLFVATGARYCELLREFSEENICDYWQLLILLLVIYKIARVRQGRRKSYGEYTWSSAIYHSVELLEYTLTPVN